MQELMVETSVTEGYVRRMDLGMNPEPVMILYVT
jgi:hypothetical protein